MDKNGKKCIAKLNQNKQFEYDGTTYQLIGDASIDEDDDRDIEAYLEENGINYENLKLHAFDQLEKQMNDDGKLVCYITHIILNCEKGSMYYLSPERLLQDKPYLYKDEFGSIQRNFVFICQKLNGKKQMTLHKFIKLSIASYLNKIYGVTIHMCHQVEKGQFEGIPSPRLKRIQEHLHKIQEEYDECVDYLTKSRSGMTKPVLYESLQRICEHIKNRGKKRIEKRRYRNNQAITYNMEATIRVMLLYRLSIAYKVRAY